VSDERSAESGTRFAIARPAYFAVGLLAVGTTALVQRPALLVLYLIPLAAALYVARTSTSVDADGLTVRAMFGRRTLPWAEVRGLSVSGNAIYAVATDGAALRLPCVRVSDLARLSRSSGGHVPEMIEATPKYAPQAQRRR